MSDMLDIESTKADPDVISVIQRIAEVSCELSEIISRGNLHEVLNASTGINSDGDSQKKLDLIADQAYFSGLIDSDVKYYASEEKEALHRLNSSGSLGIAIDPLDGSSNIDTNVSIGSIFSIRRICGDSSQDLEEAKKFFLQPGRNQVAAGYIIFGPQTILVMTTGHGVQQYVLDRSIKKFCLTKENTRIPEDTKEYAVNASNARHWSRAMKTYIEDSNAGDTGPRGTNFNMRWIASLVAEAHRIMTRGGIFIYPADNRKNYSAGRLRMVYECAPIAFLIEQAGGAATDCISSLMDLPATDLHARTPFAFGSRNEVVRLQAYHTLPDQASSPLFKKRGLFRVEGTSK